MIVRILSSWLRTRPGAGRAPTPSPVLARADPDDASDGTAHSRSPTMDEIRPPRGYAKSEPGQRVSVLCRNRVARHALGSDGLALRVHGSHEVVIAGLARAEARATPRAAYV